MGSLDRRRGAAGTSIRGLTGAGRFGAFVLSITASGLFDAGTVEAQDALAEAEALFQEAEFEDALAALDRVEASARFDRDAYLRLLRRKATILFALGDDSWRQSLAILASVAPEEELGAEAPPPLRRAYSEIRGATEAVRLSVEATPTDDGVQLRGEARAIPPGLQASVRVYGRGAEGRWQEGEGELEIEEPPPPALRYYAELLGPGQAILQATGSRSDPQLFTIEEGAEATVVEDGEEEGGVSPWPFVAVGAGVAVAAVVITVILLAVQEPDTRVDLPSPP
ncbi:MAG: hypothetical protein AAGF12_29560 [Myxococcota bacterium]